MIQYIIITLILLTGVTFVTATENYIIEGNTVYMNDSNAYLSAIPHTIHKKANVEFNLEVKKGNGEIDVVFGFPDEVETPSNVEYYSTKLIHWNTTSSRTYNNVISFDTTSKPCQVGNEYNNIKRNGTYRIEGNDSNFTDYSVIVCFDNFTNEGDNYTLNWYTEHSEPEGWKIVQHAFFKFNREYQGISEWWVKSFDVNINQTYRLRADIETHTPSGKYWFCAKPQSETINEAIASNHLYCLDPWWDSSVDETLYDDCADDEVTTKFSSAGRPAFTFNTDMYEGSVAGSSGTNVLLRNGSQAPDTLIGFQADVVVAYSTTAQEASICIGETDEVNGCFPFGDASDPGCSIGGYCIQSNRDGNVYLTRLNATGRGHVNIATCSGWDPTPNYESWSLFYLGGNITAYNGSYTCTVADATWTPDSSWGYFFVGNDGTTRRSKWQVRNIYDITLITDTCTAPAVNNDWEIDMSDECVLSSNVNLGTGKLNFTGTGNFHCNAQINTTNMGDPGATGNIWINASCDILVS